MTDSEIKHYATYEQSEALFDLKNRIIGEALSTYDYDDLDDLNNYKLACEKSIRIRYKKRESVFIMESSINYETYKINSNGRIETITKVTKKGYGHLDYIIDSTGDFCFVMFYVYLVAFIISLILGLITELDIFTYFFFGSIALGVINIIVVGVLVLLSFLM